MQLACADIGQTSIHEVIHSPRVSTGSYIFSETQFAMRAGVRSRACALTIIGCMAIAWALPISLVTVVPASFFGAVLCFIAVELLVDWLVEARERCSRIEYAIVLLSYGAINLLGVELGMLCGILAQSISFIVIYSRSGTLLTQRFWHSNVIRGFKQRSLTSKLRAHIITLELHGFMFFGSEVKILSAVQRACFPTASASASPSQAADKAREDSSSVVVAAASKTRYLILDFYHVTGLDSTAAATCFVTLCQQAEEHGMLLCFCNLRRSVRQLLEVQQVLPLNPKANANNAAAVDGGDEAWRWPVRSFDTTGDFCVCFLLHFLLSLLLLFLLLLLLVLLVLLYCIASVHSRSRTRVLTPVHWL